MGDAEKWLLDQADCIVTLWNGAPITVTPPNFVELEIIDTDPGLKGDTAGTGGKPATLSTGAVVKVPLFVQIGEVIKVDTRSGEYVSRVNNLSLRDKKSGQYLINIGRFLLPAH